MSPPHVDLVITFRTTRKTSLSKQQVREDAQNAEAQYTRLSQTLNKAGLRAVARRGEALGHLLVFVSCPKALLLTLVKRERHYDFLYGLPTTPLSHDAAAVPLSSSQRLRLVYTFITSLPEEGGLGIAPGLDDWDLVETILPLHDRQFNEAWIRHWTPREAVSVELEKIQQQYGDTIAFYFDFLASYTKALMFPAALGMVFYVFDSSYSPTYSIFLFIWSVAFVEWWRVRERILSLQFRTRGSFLVEKRWIGCQPGFPWWKRELRMVASLPIILLCGGLLTAILTGIFVLEAFVTAIYHGPGHQFIALGPTILFAGLVPQFLAVYQFLARKLTIWENHSHHSTYVASLTLKTFALGALVAYLGLGLSAFVYVPFGEGVMQITQTWLSTAQLNPRTTATMAAFTSAVDKVVTNSSIWDIDTASAGRKLNPTRLRQQMFAFTVTNQAINTFMEVGLPFVLRAVASFRSNSSGGKNKAKAEAAARPGSPSGAGGSKNGGAVKKRVVFEDEKERGGMEEREFLDGVRAQVELPECDMFKEYSEMVTQFGYVALWSTIWPLAPAMALLNNLLELRSDAFKMTVHKRRPIPTRTDTIGPWLETLTFLSWLSALTNSALVYLFRPPSGSAGVKIQSLFSDSSPGTKELLLTALLIMLLASHGYTLVRAAMQHIIERVFWKGSEEVQEWEKADRRMKAKFLGDFAGTDTSSALRINGGRVGTAEQDCGNESPDAGDVAGFWDHDEGMDEISRVSKEV